MRTRTPARHPAGSPAGGRFAPTCHAESDVDLGGSGPQPSEPVTSGAFVTDTVSRPPGLAGVWSDRAVDGLDTMARDSGTRWEVTSVEPLDDDQGVVVYAREEVSGERYKINAGSTFVSVKSESALTGAMGFTMAAEPVEDVSRLVAFHVDEVRRRRQTERMLEAAADRAPLPDRVRLAHGWQCPTFTRGKDQLQLAAGDGDADLRLFVTTPDPVTAAPVVGGYEVRLDGNLRVTPQADEPVPSNLTVDQTNRLCQWVDGITGDEGLLWRVSVSATASRRPGPGYRADDLRLR